MRQSKVKRQEAKRERGRLFGGRMRQKEEKAEPTRYTVVCAEDVRQPKYLFCGAESFDGYPLEHAERLAAPVPGQENRYAVVPLEVHRWARAQGEPLSPKAAMAGYEKEAA
jgi:hypothetical protein